jgi:hypothetical protein
MSRHKFPRDQNQKPAGASRPTVTAELNQNESDFAPSSDEMASFVSQGSSQGHEAQHWLAAEAELIAERNRTRVHGFHDKTKK